MPRSLRLLELLRPAVPLCVVAAVSWIVLAAQGELDNALGAVSGFAAVGGARAVWWWARTRNLHVLASPDGVVRVQGTAMFRRRASEWRLAPSDHAVVVAGPRFFERHRFACGTYLQLHGDEKAAPESSPEVLFPAPEVLRSLKGQDIHCVIGRRGSPCPAGGRVVTPPGWVLG